MRRALPRCRRAAERLFLPEDIYGRRRFLPAPGKPKETGHRPSRASRERSRSAPARPRKFLTGTSAPCWNSCTGKFHTSIKRRSRVGNAVRGEKLVPNVEI